MFLVAGHASATVIGEAGTRGSMDSAEWNSVSLTESYGSTPHVFATTQTTNGGQDPSAAHVRSFSTTGFSTQHCEWDLPDTCDAHATETNGWVAIDPGDVNGIDGMETGTLSVSGTSGSWGDDHAVSFSTSFANPPLVFAQVQTENGGDEPLNAQVDGVTTSGFTAEFCQQEKTNTCDGHTSETMAWWAIDPGVVSEEAGFEFGTVSVTSSAWETVSFSQSFASTPVVIAMSQTENGESEALYPEVDSVSTAGASVRYCEGHDGDASSPEDACDSHRTETVAWLAVEPGAVDVGGGSGGGMSEDFDDGTADGWSLSGLWHVSDICETPPSTPNYLGYNQDITCDYDTGSQTTGAARFSEDLSGASSATWTFDHKWETESTSSTAYDVMRVEASTDGGSTWDTLQQWDSTDANQASWGSESFSLDGYTGGTVDLRFFFDSKDSVANTYLGWLVDNVEVTTSDGGGGGGNSAPTADFTYGCTNLDCSFTDQSSDSDGSIASWSWDFGDGATSSQQHPTHTYDCGGVYTVTLTVTDDDGATGSTSRDVTVSDADSDGDGLSNCVEEQGGLNACSQSWDPTDPTDPDTDFDGLDDGAEVNTHCTVPNDPDTDDDEFEDGPEVNNFGKPSIFCGSSCAYPDPFTPDLYLEVDFWEHDDALGNPERHTMSNSVRSDLEAIFSNQGIDAHIDNGQLGGGGTVIEGDFEVSWSFLRNNVYRNTNYFDSDRQGIFHQMIYVHDLTLDGARVCGVGGSGYEFSAVAHGEIYDGFYDLPQCHTDNDAAVRIVTAQELGHNDFSTIEPSEDHCGGDGGTAHDNKEGYSMATPYCGGWADWDYHGNRWTEHKGYVADGIDDSECTEQSFNDGDPMTCPSPGDLNRGVR